MSKFIHGPAVAGQSVVDRVLAAKHTVAGQSLAKVICKATTEEVMGPKRKHLDYLLQCTNEANVSVPEMANLLIERTQNANWVVVFKALITVHNLMNYGNERFTHYLASNNCTFNLGSFTDRSGTQGYDMSTYIRRYAKYLSEKALSYRLMAFDFCKVKRGKEDGILRTMNTEKLLKTLPILQSQLDALVEFDVSASELTNGVINAAFMLLFKDLIRLFACYNDGIINLLEKYFEMHKKSCKEALDVYKKFLLRMDKVCEFLKVAENVGIDKGDIPDLAKAPSSLLEALEQHLVSLENSKKTGAVPPKLTSGLSAVINNYASASLLGAAPGADSGVSQISDDERRCILEEEQRQLDQMKQKKLQELTSSSPLTIPFSSGSGVGASIGSSSVNVTDKNVLSSVDCSHPSSTGNDNMSAELLYLNDSQVMPSRSPESVPFIETFVSSHCASPFDSCSAASTTSPFGFISHPVNMTSPSWSNQLQTSSQGFDSYKQILQPVVPSTSGTHISIAGCVTANQSTATSEKLIKADLDSSLASLAGNLNIRTSPQVKKMDHQWFNTGEKRITGSRSTWNPSVPSSSHPIQVQQLHPMPVGQLSSFGWVAQPNIYAMPNATFMQSHIHPNVHPAAPDDPFGSL